VNRRHIKITYLLTAPEPARGGHNELACSKYTRTLINKCLATCRKQHVGQRKDKATDHGQVAALSLKYNFLGYRADVQTCTEFRDRSSDQSAHQTVGSSRRVFEPGHISQFSENDKQRNYQGSVFVVLHKSNNTQVIMHIIQFYGQNKVLINYMGSLKLHSQV